MSLVLNDRVRETTTIVGTGTATLLGAAAGYQSFAVIGNANTCYYTISDQAGTNWEVGIGTYVSATPALSRTTVLASSNAGALVSFTAGTKDIFVTYPAETAMSGGGGGTYPTIQPTLNLDFANTKLLDPRITFVRNSTAAYYDGQTSALAEQNLLLQSQTFATTWVTSNTTLGSVTTAPDGTTTAYPLTASAINGTLLQTFTATATAYTFSIYIQRVTGTGNIDITVDGTTYATQTTTGTWTRFTITTTPAAGSKTAGIRLAVSGDVVNIWGGQLEQRSSVTAYTPTTTAPITNYIPVLMTAPAGVARFDCDPITRNSLGLLIEESRTNLLLYSATFSNAAWTLTNATLTAAATIAPDGTQTAFNLVSNTSTGLQAIAQTITKAASALAYTSTVHFKANQYTYSWLQISDGAGNGAIVYFNLTTGAISTAVAGIGTAFTALSATTPTSIGNGWYRCNITGTSNTATSLVTQFGSSTNGTSNSVVGNGYSGVYAWGCQAEAGSFATSYVATLASTVTRAADQASMTGTNFSSWYNQAQGAVCFEWNTATSTVVTMGVKFSDGTEANRVQIGATTIGSAAVRVFVITNSVQQNNTTVGTNSVNTFGKSLFTWATNNFLGSFNGSLSTAGTSGNVPTVNMMTIGYDAVSPGYLNGHIRKLSYYPVALSSSNLVALTS